MRTRPLLAALLLAALAHGGCRGAAIHSALAAQHPEWTDPSFEQCGFVPRHAHPDPVELVRELARLDGQGAFLRAHPWLSTAVNCPGYLPAPDLFTLIESYEVQPLRVGPDTARVAVRYRELGQASPAGFTRAQRETTEVFDLVRSPYGWRILHPTMPLRVLASAVPALPPEDASSDAAPHHP